MLQQPVRPGLRYDGVNSRTMRRLGQSRALGHREEDHDHSRKSFDKHRSGLEPIQDGHGEIKDDQIGKGAPGNFNRLPAVLRRTAYFKVGVCFDQAV